MTEQDRKPVQMRRVFKESFNPDGRPKGSKNRKTILRDIAHQPCQVMLNGEIIIMSVLQAIVTTLSKKAMDGTSGPATKEYERLLEKYNPEVTDDNVGYLVVPAPISAEDWIKREMEANKTRKPPPGVDDTDDDEDRDDD